MSNSTWKFQNNGIGYGDGEKNYGGVVQSSGGNFFGIIYSDKVEGSILKSEKFSKLNEAVTFVEDFIDKNFVEVDGVDCVVLRRKSFKD